jgi:pimeloyl-ACP methyl ester carboxylesterase
LEAVVFVPGLACTERLFAPQIAALARSKDIILANHRLHDSIAEIAQGILYSAPARFSLVGLSMGGFISLEIMRKAPERVSRLVLMDTNARQDSAERTATRKKQLQAVAEGRFEELPQALFESYVPEWRHADAELLEAVRAMAIATGPAVFVRQVAAVMGREDSRAALAAIGVPTLVVVGEHDQLSPPALSQEMANAIEGAELAIIKDCGHLPTLEQPEKTNRILLDFLA